MPEIIILYLISTGLPEAVYVGETALMTCLNTALTYEEPVAREPPASEHMPYMMQQLLTSPRPISRSTAQGF